MNDKKYQIAVRKDETDPTCKSEIFKEDLTKEEALFGVEALLRATSIISTGDIFYKVDDDMWLSTLGISIRIEEMKE